MDVAENELGIHCFTPAESQVCPLYVTWFQPCNSWAGETFNGGLIGL